MPTIGYARVRQGVPWSESPNDRVRSAIAAEVGGRLRFSPLRSSDSSPMPHHTTKFSPIFPNSGSNEKSWSRPTVLHAAVNFTKRLGLRLVKLQGLS